MKAFELLNGDVHPDILVSGVDAIRANLEARLSIIRGEYMPNVMLGIPLNATKDETDLYVQKIILGTKGVRSIDKFSSAIVDKVYKCKFFATTDFGGLDYE